MIRLGGVDCQELVRGFGEGIPSSGGPVAEKSYLCNWVDRFAVIYGLLGSSNLTGGTGGLVSLTHPHIYPESTGMYARSVNVKGVGGLFQGPRQLAREKAVVTAEYGVPNFTIDGGDGGSVPGDNLHDIDQETPLRYASQSLTFGTEVQTINPGKLKYGTVPKPYPVQYGLHIGVVYLNITLHRLPFLITPQMRTGVQRMNSVKFLGCDPGTLKLVDISTNRNFNDIDGTPVQETRMSLAWRPDATWDKVADPTGDTDDWFPLTWGNGHPVCKSFDMNILIPSGYRR